MKLDFKNHTHIDHGYLLIPSPNKLLEKHPDIYDRFCGVIYLITKIDGNSDVHIASNLAKSMACTRSALSEFVSIVEYLKENYPKLANHNYRIYSSTNPILHMIKLLRNYNIHLSESILSEKKMSVTTAIDPSIEHELTVKYISNLSAQELRKLRSSKDYDDNCLSSMIECFNIEQHIFGVSTLLMKSALEYADHIATILETDRAMCL